MRSTCTDGSTAPRWRRDPRRCQHHRRARPRRRLQGDHRAAPGGRPAVLRHHRQGGRPLRGRGAPAGPAPARRRGHADRRGHRSAPGGLPPPGDDRHPGRRATSPRSADALADDAGGRLRRDHRRQLRPARRGRLRGRRPPARAPHQADPHPPGRARPPRRSSTSSSTSSSTTGVPDDHRPVRRLGAQLRPAHRAPERCTPTPPATTCGCTSRGTRSSRTAGRRPGPLRADHHPRRGPHDLGRPRQRVHRRPRRAVRRAGRPRPRRARRGGGQAGAASWRSSRCGPTPTRGPSSSPSGSRTTPPATSTGSSSPPAAARPSRPPGSWPSSTSSSPASRPSTRSSRRAVAYHGTPQGALSITGIPAAKVDVRAAGARRATRCPNTNLYRAPEHLRDDEKAFGRWAADRIAEAIEFEGPDTVAAVFLEPVQNSGGCFPPPPGYFERVREICDEYDVLLVSDEVDLRVRPDRLDVRLRRLRLRSRTSSPAPRA